MINKYRPLDKEKDWRFFDDNLPISTEGLGQIKALTEDYAEELWQKCVGPKAAKCNDKDFLIQILQSSKKKTNWLEAWNQNRADEIISFFSVHIAWPDETIIFFFESRCYAIETSWGIFRKHWMNFLFNDEWPILLSQKYPERIIFSPSGELGIA